MKKESYILKNQIHFGSLKTSVPKGTKVIVDRDKNVAEFNGVIHENIVHEVDLMINAGYIVEYSEGDEIQQTKVIPKKKREKLEVLERSGVEIPIKNDKDDESQSSSRNDLRKKKMTVIREGKTVDLDE